MGNTSVTFKTLFNAKFAQVIMNETRFHKKSEISLASVVQVRLKKAINQYQDEIEKIDEQYHVTEDIKEESGNKHTKRYVPEEKQKEREKAKSNVRLQVDFDGNQLNMLRSAVDLFPSTMIDKRTGQVGLKGKEIEMYLQLCDDLGIDYDKAGIENAQSVSK